MPSVGLILIYISYHLTTNLKELVLLSQWFSKKRSYFVVYSGLDFTT